MSKQYKKIPPIEIPTESYEAFRQLAEEQNVSLSQMIRDAMRHWYIYWTGVDVDFSVGDWGGDRRSKASLESNETPES